MDSQKTQQNAWGIASTKPTETINFAEIMSEEYAHRVQNQEQKRFEERLLQQAKQAATDAEIATAINTETQPSHLYSAVANASSVNDEKQSQEGEWEDYSALLTAAQEEDTVECNSDAVIAQMLQSQFDHEYNEELRRIEHKRNKDSKVTVTLDKYRRNGDLEFLNDSDDSLENDEEASGHKRDWDRFETNEKILDTIPKCGFKLDKEGEMITKHDPQLCGVRNACRVMSFPPEFPTGDGAGFDMKLSNQVFNQLKTYSRRGNKKNKMHDRKANVATAEMGVDAPTRLLLYKLINNQILEQINGIISTGKEAVILHGNSDPAYAEIAENASGYSGTICSPQLLPKECAIKIFKTTLNEFKQRDRYIKDDYRFKDRFSKQNNRVIINMWAEKEMHNIMRMQSVGINCPDVVVLKKHVLVMSFIGDNHNAAPKLKDARLSQSELSCAYEEIVAAMHKLYNEAKLVHADLSEYNILWYDDKCWFIDVAQSVEPEHPSALEFLMRDCGNIINFFEKRGLPNIYSKEQLFEYITSLNAETHNAAMLERIHTRGASIAEATAPYQEQCPDELKPIAYPFDLAWEKSQSERQQQATNSVIDKAATAFEVLNINTPGVEQENK
ncbi:serine/threonine-protein kinase RIO3 [Zeugodacus cucurbitae]|uniref:serine/threonine-protein kinase RIO3 n=1 Tax=Zeugodacus cucurbitae TaxID=28588 RepID=UPI0023D8F637|nr:serine/threonine-protein kinase RIO3 [Zeugodacus cucurbitae]